MEHDYGPASTVPLAQTRLAPHTHCPRWGALQLSAALTLSGLNVSGWGQLLSPAQKATPGLVSWHRGRAESGLGDTVPVTAVGQPAGGKGVAGRGERARGVPAPWVPGSRAPGGRRAAAGRWHRGSGSASAGGPSARSPASPGAAPTGCPALAPGPPGPSPLVAAPGKPGLCKTSRRCCWPRSNPVGHPGRDERSVPLSPTPAATGSAPAGPAAPLPVPLP